MFSKKTQIRSIPIEELSERLRLNSAAMTTAIQAGVRADHPEMKHYARLANLARLEPVTLTDLAIAEHVSRPTMSQSLGRMIKMGLVEKRRNPDDRRSTLFFLTGKGKARLALARQSHEAQIINIITEMGEANKAVLEMALPILEAITNKIEANAYRRYG